MENLKSIIESLLFVSDEPLSIERLKTVLSPATANDIRGALHLLAQEHEVRQGGFQLKEIAGGYQFRTRPEFSEWITKLVQPRAPRLSKAALETLAIIAYKQPVIRSDVEYIRGVDCGGVIRVLLERNLIRVLGRREIPGRPLIYATTKRFLEVFDLKDLKDLPTPQEIEEMGQTLADRSNILIEDDAPGATTESELEPEESASDEPIEPAGNTDSAAEATDSAGSAEPTDTVAGSRHCPHA
ncbi:MAG: SMC-Scp complex subunit ScpB [Deltaproteobacteria bacterium]|nr:SMC-Scp complex subunit ScpB [Deltaproteobacteria bacterium]